MNNIINSLIENGKFCTVEFVKKDGTLGRVHGRTGVKKYARGGSRTTDDSVYIMFYDLDKGYRNVNRETVVSVNGVNLKVKTRRGY